MVDNNEPGRRLPSRRDVLRAGAVSTAAVAFGSGSARPAHAQSAVTIDPGTRYQTLEGWGTALSWGANAIGGWRDVNARSEIVDLLFDDQNGLGLQIARYNIGATENPEHDHMRLAADIPSLWPNRPGEWDLSADAAQRWVLEQALERGVRRVEGFVTSPHYWWTNSGCIGGAADGGDNLDPAYVDDFADFVTEVVAVFRRAWGIRFDSVSPINEPSAPWWVAFGRQEGCHYSLPAQRRVLDAMAGHLDRKGLADQTRLSMADEAGATEALDAVLSYGEAAQLLGQVSTHSYHSGNRGCLRNLVRGLPAKLWMSEWGTSGDAGYEPQHISNALNLSRTMLLDLNLLQAEAWCIWNAVESVEANRDENVSWGLIHATYTKGDENFYVAKQYYGYGNYVKFVRPGSTVIRADDSRTFAAYDAQRRLLTVVHTETGAEDRELTFDLSRFAPDHGAVLRHRTSATENLTELPPEQHRDGTYTTTVKGRSITTFVFPGLRPSPGHEPDPPPEFPAFVPQSQMTATATSQQPGFEAGNVIDGHCSTLWHQSFNPYQPPPQSITLDLRCDYETVGLLYQPRQDGNRNGVITEYEISTSADGESFTPIAAGAWTADDTTKYAQWAAAPARLVRLTAVDGFNGHVSASELNIAHAAEQHMT